MLYASTAPLDAAAQNTELNRGVADAAKVGGNELVLATAYHELALGHTDAANALTLVLRLADAADDLLASAAGVLKFGAPSLARLRPKSPDTRITRPHITLSRISPGLPAIGRAQSLPRNVR